MMRKFLLIVLSSFGGCSLTNFLYLQKLKNFKVKMLLKLKAEVCSIFAEPEMVKFMVGVSLKILNLAI